ncbi:MAG: CopG family transcriptional regulator [Shewanella sp.]|uniref:CopG family transcriptional regulator n=1 Tax=Shewanella cutis TaxID=2766780 RepID=A0ABS9QY69_9GAMM|nr:CopG family transcriptional regulator [Shewanella sp. PS-2]MCG9965254.1 CopG family transcriptional regulator [Shewanella sp. PS-2]
MGLSDLKKNAMPSRGGTKPLSLDEFIDAATLYAMGETCLPTAQNAMAELVIEFPVECTQDSSNVVTLQRPKTSPILLDISQEERPHYRKATFSLSEAAIAHLASLSEESDISKSKLVRFLIEQHYALPTALRQMCELQIKKS